MFQFGMLQACRSAGTVKRVVVTSSIAAITADFDAPDKREIKDIYDEKDWTDTSRTDLSPYFKSKVRYLQFSFCSVNIKCSKYF